MTASGILFAAWLLLNALMGWWAWRRDKLNDRFRRLPSWGVINAGILLILPAVAVSRPVGPIEGARLIGMIVTVPLAVIGLVMLVVGIISHIKPFSWLEGSAGSRRARARRRKPSQG